MREKTYYSAGNYIPYSFSLPVLPVKVKETRPTASSTERLPKPRTNYCNRAFVGYSAALFINGVTNPLVYGN